MRSAILIITYTSPAQTKRLIDRLSSGPFDFYVHVDKKIDIATHKIIFDLPNVFPVTKRIDIKWGGYTLVEAIISGIEEIEKSGKAYQFIKLLSGQDYPIKSTRDIAAFFDKNQGKEFLYYESFRTEWPDAMARVEKYHFTDFPFRGRHQIQRLINWVMPKRKLPVAMELYGKETFWLLSPEVAFYAMNFIKSQPKLQRFMKFTWGCDEFIFHSVILNSKYKDRVVNYNTHFVNWPYPGADRPKFFVAEDLNRILAAEELFARKFNIDIDSKILDLLDERQG